jgi:hypothetical protein
MIADLRRNTLEAGNDTNPVVPLRDRLSGERISPVVEQPLTRYLRTSTRFGPVVSLRGTGLPDEHISPAVGQPLTCYPRIPTLLGPMVPLRDTGLSNEHISPAIGHH